MKYEGKVPQLDDIEQVSDGWIKKYILHFTLPDGTKHPYESVSRKGLDVYRREIEHGSDGTATNADAVCIVPQTADGKLVMIREFRYPINNWCVAFPAGLVDPGEQPIDSIDRELREETGYALRSDVDQPVRLLPQVGFSSAGFTDETIQVAFAQVEKTADATPEETELIEVFELAIKDVPRFLEENRTPISTRAQLILDGFALRELASC